MQFFYAPPRVHAGLEGSMMHAMTPASGSFDDFPSVHGKIAELVGSLGAAAPDVLYVHPLAGNCELAALLGCKEANTEALAAPT